MQEKEIIELIRNRDEHGAEALLRHYGPLIKYIIAPILPNHQDQEECLSEVSMRVWDKIHLYNSERGQWTTWLTALTRNVALNRIRQGRQMDNNEEALLDLPSMELTPEEEALKKERQKVLVGALEMLSPKEKLMFYRKYYYLQSTAQIASELSMTERAVEGRLYRIKKQLRRVLGGEERE